MFTRLISVLVLVMVAQASPAGASQPQPAVWVIGEGFRVDPLTGRVREEQRIDGNPIPADFDYTQKNLAWDIARRRISLADSGLGAAFTPARNSDLAFL